MTFRTVASACTFLGLILVRIGTTQGTKIGYLSSRSHGVVGTVHILDHRKIMIEGFSYDGKKKSLRRRKLK